VAHLILRKIWRLFALTFPFIYIFRPKLEVILYLSIVLVIFLLIELFRFFRPSFNYWLLKKFHLILKDKEAKTLLSTTVFLILSLLIILLFRKQVAIYCLFFLGLGDSASAIVGRNFGRIKIGKKTLEGSIAFFIICLFTAGFLRLAACLNIAWGVIIGGILTATLVELLPLPLDDNISVGLSSAIVMTLLTPLF